MRPFSFSGAVMAKRKSNKVGAQSYINALMAGGNGQAAQSDDGLPNIDELTYVGPLEGAEKKSEPASDRTWREAAHDTGLAAVQGAAGLVGGAAWLANQAGMGDGATARDMAMFSKDIEDSQKSEEMRQANQAVAKADGVGATLKALIDNPIAILDMTAQSAPMALPGMAAASLAARGTAALGKGIVARQMAATVAGVGAESLTSGTMAGNEVYQAVLASKPDDLRANSQRFRELEQSVGADRAREQLADESSRAAAALSGAGTAVGGAIAGKVAGRLGLESGYATATVGANALTPAGFAKNLARESMEEAAQSPLEDIGKGVGQKQADERVNPLDIDNLGKSALLGAVGAIGQTSATSAMQAARNGVSLREPVAPASQPQQEAAAVTQPQAAFSDAIAPDSAELLRKAGIEPDPAIASATASVESVLGAGDPTAGLVASVMRGDALKPVHDMAAVLSRQSIPVGSNEGGVYEPQWLPDADAGDSANGLPMPKYGADSQEKALANMRLDAQDAQRKAGIVNQIDALWASKQENPLQKARELEAIAGDSVVPVEIDRADTANQINQALANAAGEGNTTPNAMQLALMHAQQRATIANAEQHNNAQPDAMPAQADGKGEPAPNIAAQAPNISDVAPNIHDASREGGNPVEQLGGGNGVAPATLSISKTDRGQWVISGDMKQHAPAIREALKGVSVLISPKKGQALVQLPKDKDTAKQGKAIRKALDHLLMDGNQLAERDKQRAEAASRIKARNQQAQQLDHAKDDIVQAVAKLGGIDTEQAMSEWWRGQKETVSHYNGEVPGNLRMQGVVAFKRGGMPIDDMVRRLEGEGYLPQGSTPNDLLDALENRRMHPAGYEEQARQAFEAQAADPGQSDGQPGEFQQAYDDGRFADDFTKRELEEETDYFELNRQQREAIEAAAEAAEDQFWSDAFEGKHGSTPTEEQLDEIFGPETVASQEQTEIAAGENVAGRTEADAQGVRADGDAQGQEDGFSLASYTEGDIQRQEREAEQQRLAEERQRAAADKARQDEETRKEIRRRSEAAADTFTLGGNAEDNLTGQGGLFDAPTQEPAKPSRITEESAGNMRAGDVVRDGTGKKYLALGSRHKWLEVAPIVNGKAQVSADTTFKFHLDQETADAYPERRADPVYATGENLNEHADSETESSSAQNTGHSPEKVPDMSPNTASNSEMDSLKAEMGDAIGELAALLGVRKNLTAEEESKIIPVMSKIFRIAAKMGYVSFKDAARHVMSQIRQIGGDELANKLSIDNLQAGYINIAKEIGGDKREALAYDSIQELEGEPQQSANAPQSDSAQSATDNSAPSLVDKFAGEIANGNMPKDNNALRKMVAAMDGKQPDAFRMKQAQEDLEAAIVVAARSQVAKGQATKETFNRLVDLYQSQPNLNIRTSSSIANQAYSTPAPLAYAAAKLAGINESTHVFEPTAGNGMLLLTASPNNATANELDERRFANLQAQGFDAMQGNALDAVTSGAVAEKSQDAVITNPPFGSVKDDAGKATKVVVDGYKIGKIDHLIAADALRTLKDDGKAVLIIGADKVAGGLSTDDRIFFNWLYSHYNVTHHFEVDGSLYARQGASWPVRVIALNGRVESNGVSPKSGTVERVNTWEQVYGQLEQGLVSQDRSIDRNAASRADGSVSGATATNEQVNSPVAAGGKTRPRSNGGRARSTVGANDVGGSRARTGRNTEQLPAEGMGAADSAQRRNDAATGQTGLEPGGTERVQSASSSGSNQPSGNTGANRVATQYDASNAFQATYVPASARKDDGVLIPVNMAQPLSDALATMEDEVGDIDQFTAKELGYRSVDELHQALMGLQVDSVATSIRNLKNGNGTIIADQTGIGKGRQAAAIIRWAAKNNRIPVFVTVKPALFTDMYNDLADIGSHDIAPFILNVDESISGASGNKLFANKKATHKRALTDIANSGTLPDGSNAVFMTYSQINTANIQRSAIATIAPRAIFVLDESHNAGGESATGEYIKGLLDNAPGVVYLSATYAKRPDNMPLYFRTDIGKAIADDSALKDAMANGGLPLQTVVSNNLVKAGQMFRRERSYDGISISTVVDTGNTAKHVDLADKVTSALRAIVQADKAFHENYFESVKKALEKEGKGAYDVAGNQAGKSVDHSEFSSVVHNFVRQLLLGLKADAAADHAIAALKRGEKPLIALENTMGSFLSEYAAGSGIQVGQPLGDFDYRTVLSRALKRSRYIQVDDGAGNKSKKYIGLEKLDPVTRQEYDNAQEVIDSLQVAEIPVSPLDWIRHRLQKAGYSVAEITGRDLAVDYSKATPVLANVPSEEQSDKVLTTRRFNSGKLDAIILNVSGSTGISLHASEKFSDQRPRHMIVAQPAQDINIFMQMLGRIHRTGQVVLPNYTILNVDLPAEKRPTALLSKKMKSLNANTSSNTESATSVQSVDILNKYGDQVVSDYLQENIDLAQAMNIEVSADAAEDIARKVTGRLALMPVETQHRFYSEVEEQYQSLIDYLNKTNQNDLEPRTFDFDAKETRRETLVKASGESPFEQAADYIEFSIKAQGKAMTPDEIKSEISDNLQGKQPSEHAADMVAQLNEKYQAFIAEQQSDSAKEKAAGTKMAGERFILQHPIGSTWRVEINDDHYNAVIINVKNGHKSAGNPFSLSKTTVTIAVNGSLRQVSVPATQFEKITTGQIYSYGPYQASVDRYFSSRVADERETAKMITGNLLAAYGELSGVHGTIVNFSRADGSVDQGILLPKRFDFKQNTSGDYRFKSASDIYKFLRESNSKGVDKIGVQNREQTVRVTLDSNGIAISVPKSKAKGGKYFGDTALTKITGDFVSAGGMMNAYVDKQNAEAAIDTLIKKTALYAIPSMAEEARKIVGDEMPEPTASVESTGNKLNSKANAHTNTQGMSAKDLQAIIAKALPAHLRERVKVAQSRSNNAQQSARSEDNGLIDEAVYDPATGLLTLYADAIPTPERALFVLSHELTHYGLDAKYGSGLSSILLEARNNPMIAKLANAIAADRGMTVNSVRQDIADARGVPVARVANSEAVHRLQVETTNEALAELNAAIERNDFAYLQDRYGVAVPKMMRNDLRGRLSRLAASVKAWLAKLTGKQASDYSDKQVWDLLAGVRDVVRSNVATEGSGDGNSLNSRAGSGGAFIDVDGVKRPTTNSNGQPIHPTAEGVRNFWKWFGDSRVVDAEGRPLVVYHGTASSFDTFDTGAIGSNYGADSKGFFFTNSPEQAAVHAEDAGFTYNGNAEANTVPVYLALKNPSVVKTKGRPNDWYDANTDYALGSVEQNDSDGIIISGKDSETVYVAFAPEQIKSAIGNRGTFNGSDPNILHSTAPKQPASAGFVLPEETRGESVQRQMQDAMNRWKGVQQAISEQGGSVSEQSDVYRAEERYHGRVASRLEDFQRDTVEPLLERSAAIEATPEQIEEYLLAQHAEEANQAVSEIDPEQDTAYGMDNDEAQSILAKYQARPDFAEFKRVADEWRRISDGTLDILVSSGLIPREQANAYRAKYQFYVPVRGGDDAQAARQGTGKGLSVNAKQKRRMGHDRREERVLENLLRERERAILLAEKNNVFGYLAKLVQDNRDPKLWTYDVAPKQKQLVNKIAYVVSRNGAQIDSYSSIDAAEKAINKEILQGNGKASEYEIEKSNDPFVRMMAKPMLQDHEVQGYIDGHAVRIQLHDPLLAQQYRKMGSEYLGRLLETAKSVNRWLSKVYTAYNPRFFAKNIMRDAMSGTVNVTADEGIGMALRALKNWPSAFMTMKRFASGKQIRQDKFNILQEYRANGGSTGAAYLGDIERQRGKIESMFEDYQGAISAIGEGDGLRAARVATRKLMGGLAHFFETWNQAGENAFRLALYQAMRESGRSKAEAASAAKNATVNFNRRGELTPQLGGLYLFFNPAVQGTTRAYQAMTQGKHKAQGWALVGGLFGAAMMLAMMNRWDDDKEWEAMPDNVKNKNLLIPLGNGKRLTLPVSHEYGFVMAMANNLDAYLHGQSMGATSFKLASSFVDNYSPIGNPIGDKLDVKNGINILPTLLKIPAEIGANHTSWGGPMRPDYSDNQPDNEKMWRGTRGSVYDKAAQGISKAGEAIGLGDKYHNDMTDISPETLKYLWRTFTGGTGSFAVDMLSLGNLSINGEMPETGDVPVLDTFVRQDSVKDKRAHFFELADKAKEEYQAWHDAAKKGDTAYAGDLMQQEGEVIALGHAMQAYSKQAKALRELMAAELARDDLSIGAKRAKQKQYEAQEAEIYDAFIAAFKATKH